MTSQDIVPITNVHNMRTHGKASFYQLMDHLNLNTVVLSLVPTFVRTTLSDSA
jgi:hypothetical protein